MRPRITMPHCQAPHHTNYIAPDRRIPHHANHTTPNLSYCVHSLTKPCPNGAHFKSPSPMYNPKGANRAGERDHFSPRTITPNIAPFKTTVHDLCGISHPIRIASTASSLSLRMKIRELFGPRVPTMRPLPLSLEKPRVAVGNEPRDNKVRCNLWMKT